MGIAAGVWILESRAALSMNSSNFTANEIKAIQWLSHASPFDAACIQRLDMGEEVFAGLAGKGVFSVCEQSYDMPSAGTVTERFYSLNKEREDVQAVLHPVRKRVTRQWDSERSGYVEREG